MAKSPDQIPAEMSTEETGSSQELNKIGLYTHEKSGKSLPATSLPQADAYARVGYVWTRDLEDMDVTPVNALVDIEEGEIVEEAK